VSDFLDRIHARDDRRDLAKRDGRPATVAVYLQGHPNMRSSLVAVLRVLGALGEDDGAAILAFPWDGLRYEHVEAIRAKLIAAYAPATARRHLAAVRGVLKTAWKMERVGREDYERAVNVDPITGDGEPAGRMLSPEEIARLFVACGCARDAALVALAVVTGLRREELSRLDLASFDGFKITVIGKGRKRREVFLPTAGRSRELLRMWLAERGDGAGALFWRLDRGGKPVRGSRLTPAGVWSVLTSLGRKAKLAPPITPHDFRRTFVSTLLDRGVDLPTVQTLAGHADPKTTGKYDRRGDERKKAAAEKLADAFNREEN
jgi:integrase